MAKLAQVLIITLSILIIAALVHAWVDETPLNDMLAPEPTPQGGSAADVSPTPIIVTEYIFCKGNTFSCERHDACMGTLKCSVPTPTPNPTPGSGDSTNGLVSVSTSRNGQIQTGVYIPNLALTADYFIINARWVAMKGVHLGVVIYKRQGKKVIQPYIYAKTFIQDDVTTFGCQTADGPDQCQVNYLLYPANLSPSQSATYFADWLATPGNSFVVSFVVNRFYGDPFPWVINLHTDGTVSHESYTHSVNLPPAGCQLNSNAPTGWWLFLFPIVLLMRRTRFPYLLLLLSLTVHAQETTTPIAIQGDNQVIAQGTLDPATNLCIAPSVKVDSTYYDLVMDSNCTLRTKLIEQPSSMLGQIAAQLGIPKATLGSVKSTTQKVINQGPGGGGAILTCFRYGVSRYGIYNFSPLQLPSAIHTEDHAYTLVVTDTSVFEDTFDGGATWTLGSPGSRTARVSSNQSNLYEQVTFSNVQFQDVLLTSHSLIQSDYDDGVNHFPLPNEYAYSLQCWGTTSNFPYPLILTPSYNVQICLFDSLLMWTYGQTIAATAFAGQFPASAINTPAIDWPIPGGGTVHIGSLNVPWFIGNTHETHFYSFGDDCPAPWAAVPENQTYDYRNTLG